MKPSQQTILLLFLDYHGPVPYRATLPADRGKPRLVLITCGVPDVSIVTV